MFKQEWICTNPDCRIETVWTRESESGTSAPKCICGTAMKMGYTTPGFRRLEGKELESAKELFPLTSAS